MSRRSVLLRGAACAAGAATIVVARTNSAKAAMPKTAVAYQDTPKGDRQCDGCSLFVAPNACKSVAGDISPKGWCMLWRKA